MGDSVIGYSVICYTACMSLFSSKKDSNVVLVFDIGSGSVAGAIVLQSATHPPTVLYNFRSDIPFQEETTGTRLLSLMLRSLSQVAVAITREGFETAGFGSHRPKISETFVSLSAPWVLSRTTFLSLRGREPTRITAEVFATLLEQSRGEPSPKREIPAGCVQIEQKLIKSVLNGYETSKPYEKTAGEAEFAVFGSFSMPAVTEKVTDTITRLVHSTHVSFHSFTLLTFVTLRRLYPEEDNFLVIDVSGEQTELAIVKRGVLVEAVTFPFGRNHLVRLVTRHARVPAGGVSAFFTMSSEGTGTGRLFDRTRKLLEAAEEEWRVQLSRSLSSLSKELFLPTTIFLTVDADVSAVFQSAIRKGDWSTLTLSPASFRVTVITNDLLDPLVKWGPLVSRDSFVGLISAFASQLRQSTTAKLADAV